MHGGPTRDPMQVGAERIKNGKVVELERCGHTVQMDCSMEYNSAVLGFIGGKGGPARPSGESVG